MKDFISINFNPLYGLGGRRDVIYSVGYFKEKIIMIEIVPNIFQSLGI